MLGDAKTPKDPRCLTNGDEPRTFKTARLAAAPMSGAAGVQDFRRSRVRFDGARLGFLRMPHGSVRSASPDDRRHCPARRDVRVLSSTAVYLGSWASWGSFGPSVVARVRLVFVTSALRARRTRPPSGPQACVRAAGPSARPSCAMICSCGSRVRSCCCLARVRAAPWPNAGATWSAAQPATGNSNPFPPMWLP